VLLLWYTESNTLSSDAPVWELYLVIKSAELTSLSRGSISAVVADRHALSLRHRTHNGATPGGRLLKWKSIFRGEGQFWAQKCTYVIRILNLLEKKEFELFGIRYLKGISITLM